MFAELFGVGKEFGIDQAPAFVGDAELVGFLVQRRGVDIGQRIESHAFVVNGLEHQIRPLVDNAQHAGGPSAVAKIDQRALARQVDQSRAQIGDGAFGVADDLRIARRGGIRSHVALVPFAGGKHCLPPRNPVS